MDFYYGFQQTYYLKAKMYVHVTIHIYIEENCSDVCRLAIFMLRK